MMGPLVVSSFLLFQNNPTIATITTPVRRLLHGGTFISLGRTNNKAFLAQQYINVCKSQAFSLVWDFLFSSYWMARKVTELFSFHDQMRKNWCPILWLPYFWVIWKEHISTVIINHLYHLFDNVYNFCSCIAWLGLLISFPFSETLLINREVSS